MFSDLRVLKYLMTLSQGFSFSLALWYFSIEVTYNQSFVISIDVKSLERGRSPHAANSLAISLGSFTSKPSQW